MPCLDLAHTEQMNPSLVSIQRLGIYSSDLLCILVVPVDDLTPAAQELMIHIR